MGSAARPESRRFEIFVVSPTGTWDAGLPIAASRAGAVGLLDLTYLLDVARASAAILRLRELGRKSTGVVLHARDDQFNRSVLELLGPCDTIVLVPDGESDLSAALALSQTFARRVGLVACCEQEAESASAHSFDFVVAKGHESGGRVREETAFVLIQRLIRWNKLPVVAWGGVGLHTAAACKVAGAAGVALDWQLALTRESPLPERFRQRIAAMDGSETIAIAGPHGTFFRVFTRPGMTAREKLQNLSDSLQLATSMNGQLSESQRTWKSSIATMLAESNLDARLWPVGQDAAFAAGFSEGATSVARCLRRLIEHVDRQVEGASSTDLLGKSSPLARSHGTDYPIVQGPMTRVSDVPEFIKAVADGGGLPFLALALMREKEAKPVLEKTKALLGNKAWGVGILGFVEREIRAEQLAEIEAVRPPFAIIAGGRPDQAASMEAKGIATYLHVPSPNMLDTFVREGARRFIFEGRECGGHVGPRSSFVLWDTMIRVLLAAELSAEEAAKIHLLFAGGVNDGLSGAMVSALAQPLAARGMKIGVLLGTAYLFTHEIVQSGAIVPGFQQVAVDTDHTILIETGPGHSIRCANTEYIRHFEGEKLRMKQEGKDHEAIRDELEKANIGRLRIAAKGITRAVNVEPGQNPYVRVDENGQLIDGIYMIGQVAALRRGRCSVRELHEDVCDGAAVHLRHTRPQSRIDVVEREQTPPTLDIAIVGLSCLLPGSNDVHTFWRNILANRDCVTEIPADRFDAMRWYDADRNTRDKIYSRWGGFLSDVPFDPLKYGIPPAAMKSIEPMQLLTLELVDQALRDAGYTDGKTWRPRTGVVFGVGGGVAELSAAYTFRAMLPQYIDTAGENLLAELPEWTEDSFAGILPNVVAGRVANRFDLGGPNFTVDAACASSLAAVYLACRELADGSADMMITGGCDTMQNPLAYMCFATAGALSPRGRSRAFDHTADGIVISEGLAALVLKRREDAERDGDRIYAVIRAVAGGSDGRTKAIATPCSDGQLRTLKRAYAQAGFSPATVGLYEAHGTGTSVGDQAESLGIGGLLRTEGAKVRSVAIGSAKSVVGHTKCAAGVVGLMKATLALHHRVLPPTLHVEKPNPKCGFEDGPLYVNSEVRPWIGGGHPRRAGVSSFGFGGSNFHAVLEEYSGDAVSRTLTAPDTARPAELVALTASTRADLLNKLRRTLADLTTLSNRNAEASLADIAYTIHRRDATARGTCRVAFVCTDLPELTTQITHFTNVLAAGGEKLGSLPTGTYFCDTPLAPDVCVAFLFPGQGSQHPDMFRDLAVQFGEVAEVFGYADSVLANDAPQSSRPLSSHIFPPPSFSDDDRARALKELTATDVAQPALGACGLAAHRLLRSFGLVPNVTAGHSYGELVALCAAGAMNEETMLKLSRQRATAIVSVMRDERGIDLGRMMAVRASQVRVREVLAQYPDVWVANCNSPQQVVISGTTEGLARAARALEQLAIDVTPIPVACAFHSPIMSAARERFAKSLVGVRFVGPTIPVFSNVTAGRYDQDGADIASTLADQLVCEVRFAEEIAAMYDAGVRVFIEAGPHHVLTKLAAETLGDRPHLAVAMQPRGVNGLTAWLNGLATLLVHGLPVDMDRCYAGRALTTVDFNAAASPQKSRHLWLLNGGYVRPADAPKRLPTPVKLVPPGQGSVLPAPQDGATTEPDDRQVARQPLTTERFERYPTTPANSSRAVDAGATLSRVDIEVYAEFQETMRKFLETQQSVVTAYFGGESSAVEDVGSLPPGEETAHWTPRQPAAPSRMPAAANAKQNFQPAGKTIAERDSVLGAHRAVLSPPESTVNGPAVRTADAVVDLRERLTQIVSERTGYPAEMLDFAATLESDLGIDSIKRVEIIGAFRRAVLPTMQDAPSWFMERMTAAKTLNEVLVGVSELVGGGKVGSHGPRVSDHKVDDTPKTRREKLAVGSTHSAVDLHEQLLQVVAERTGYPQEMLDLAANLESDLGIDSIKRVEIIGAFRRSVLPTMQEAPSWFMERMTAARTLNEILAAVGELIDGPEIKLSEPRAAHGGAAERTGTTGPIADLRERLLQVVAERTGYPPEMLDFSANLESDLGIDSIKRVEIIGAFRRLVLPTMQEAPSWFMEQMTAAKTLNEILKGVERLVSGVGEEPPPSPPIQPAGPPASPSVASSSVSRADRPVVERTPRCVAVAIETPVDEAARVKHPGRVVLTADNHGVARVIEAHLTAIGAKVFTLPTESLGSAEATRAAFEQIRKQGSIDWVIHLLPLQEATPFPGISDADWSRNVAAELRGALFLLQAMGPEFSNAGANHRPFFVALTLGGGDFDSAGRNECAFPWRGGLAGLLKTAQKEWPNARIRAIDFDELPNGVLPDLLLRESAVDGPVEVGYRDGRRLAIVPVRAELEEAGAKPIAVDNNSVIVWTGGARGITAEIAQEFAARTRATMILLGRSALLPDEQAETAGIQEATALRRALIERAQRAGTPVSPKDIETQARRIFASREIRSTLDALRRAGSRAEYIACDVRDAMSLEAALSDVARRFGSIDGIVHGAGIIEDKLIPDKTVESFDRVLSTKLDPVMTLCRVVDLERLKFFAIFSSVAGFFGNPGQGDYAAANEVLNRIARKLQTRMAGKVVAFNWGPWSGAGMVAPEVAKQFESRGVGMVTVQAGRSAAWNELLHPGSDSPRVLIGPGPWIAEADLAATATPAIRVRTPLLSGQKVYRRPGGVLEATVSLDPSRLAYLSDHRIDGKAVLALAVATELMAEVAAAAEPGLELTTLSNIRQLSGVIVEQDRREILIRAERIARSASAAEYRVRISDPAPSSRMYYESMVQLERDIPAPPPAPEIVRIAGRFPHDTRGAYEKWLFHGPAFQVIESLGGADNSGIDAIVRPSCVSTCAGVAGDGAWLIDPMVLDAAPQLAILWSRAMFDTTPLPNRVKAFHRYARFHQGPVDIVFRVTEPADGTTFKADVWFINQDRVVGFMEGLEGAGSARLNRLAERTIR